MRFMTIFAQFGVVASFMANADLAPGADGKPQGTERRVAVIIDQVNKGPRFFRLPAGCKILSEHIVLGSPRVDVLNVAGPSNLRATVSWRAPEFSESNKNECVGKCPASYEPFAIPSSKADDTQVGLTCIRLEEAGR